MEFSIAALVASEAASLHVHRLFRLDLSESCGALSFERRVGPRDFPRAFQDVLVSQPQTIETLETWGNHCAWKDCSNLLVTICLGIMGVSSFRAALGEESFREAQQILHESLEPDPVARWHGRVLKRSPSHHGFQYQVMDDLDSLGFSHQFRTLPYYIILSQLHIITIAST